MPTVASGFGCTLPDAAKQPLFVGCKERVGCPGNEPGFKGWPPSVLSVANCRYSSVDPNIARRVGRQGTNPDSRESNLAAPEAIPRHVRALEPSSRSCRARLLNPFGGQTDLGFRLSSVSHPDSGLDQSTVARVLMRPK